MLKTDAEAYNCPYKYDAGVGEIKCCSDDCLAWRETTENTHGYCVFIGDVVRITPELTVKRGTLSLSDADSYDFGTKIVDIDGPAFVEITCSNTGTGILKFSGTPKISITGSTDDFKVMNNNLQDECPPDMIQTFKIYFKPLTTGAKTATISITNNDLDNTPFTLVFTGTGA
jgi:hypothetical protein